MAETSAGDLYEILAAAGGRAGVLWTLKQSQDLNANLVRFPFGEGVEDHVNDEVDVLFVGVSGTGALSIDGDERSLVSATVALVPKGVRRSIRSASDDFAYLTVHHRRGPLQIGPRTPVA
ncbi:MAG: cupin domain-containing protein [Actinobacteria bacterium]|nr:cupin domain-containing protein [Actinomycetota bacterium]